MFWVYFSSSRVCVKVSRHTRIGWQPPSGCRGLVAKPRRNRSGTSRMVDCVRALGCRGGRLDGGGLGHQAPTKPALRHDPGNFKAHPWTSPTAVSSKRDGKLSGSLPAVHLDPRNQMTTDSKKATTKSPAKPAAKPGLNEEPYRGMLARAHDRASRALGRYGEPRMSVQQLREATSTLTVSLSETVLAERRAGW